jgi:hypothetical protein
MTKKSEPDEKEWDLSAERESWNEDFACTLIGRLVLVGLTRLNAGGEEIEATQFYGRVISAHKTRGITIGLEGMRAGETYNLPPDTSALHPAKRGEYRLTSTGEIVVDPDFTTTWTSRQGAN